MTRITILGTNGAVLDRGGDTVSFVINERYLVDTGWNVVGNLLQQGIDPLAIEYVIFTHLHPDHYLSLPALLFYRAMRMREVAGLKIIGPASDVEDAVRDAMQFLQRGGRLAWITNPPTVIPLAPGEGYADPAFTLATCASVHPAPALCYRFADTASGQTFAFTGDTAYSPPIAAHVRGVPLLIHEATFGATETDPDANPALHSSAFDAARIASEAEVGTLLLMHCGYERRQGAVRAARTLFPRTLDYPVAGQTLVL